jgi:hypothetical protein
VARRARAAWLELVGEIFARVSGDAFSPVGAEDAEYVAGLRAAVVSSGARRLTWGFRGVRAVSGRSGRCGWVYLLADDER